MAKEKPAVSTQCDKFDALKDAVMCDSPDGVSKMLKSSGELEFTALALGLACRYRGLDMVRVLVENGAKFTYDHFALTALYKKAKRNISVLYPDDNFAAALLDSCGLVKHLINTGKAYNRPVLPINDRLRVLSYLYKTADQTGFDGDELLFFSILSGEEKITDFLKKHGAVIPQKWVDIVTKGNGGDRWLNYCWLVRQLPDGEFISRLTALTSEIGECKLHFTPLFWTQNKHRLDTPGYMKFLLLNFDLSNIMNKTELMKETIMHEDIEALELIAELGWLKQPKKRDEMIVFASENQKTECTAWLLEFKNRKFDLAAERQRAEKKAERELLADPNSVTELKKIWKFEKRGDGSIVINGYKGKQTEITVPAKIGKDTVAAIGEYAFSPYAPRITQEAREFRRTITRITLPESVRVIGANAFFHCSALRLVNIPNGVTEIADNTFYRCIGLEKLEIPDSVKTIGGDALLFCTSLESIVIPEGVEEIKYDLFETCENLKTVELPRSLKTFVKRQFNYKNSVKFIVTVPKNSAAEEFCKERGYKFIYK